ncbi:MAG: phosphoglycerate kinase [Anaerolineae bacterium]
MNKKSIRDVVWAGKRALVRCDFNVPLDDKGNITDDTRIRASIPTIQYLLDKGAAVILCSHLGRPKGKVVESMRLTPVAARLGELLYRPVLKLKDCIGPEVQASVNIMKPGEVILLENLRFYNAEEADDPIFAQKLADLGDVYVNDAFGTAHRSHASTAGVAAYLPAVAGFLLEKEIEFLGNAVQNPKRPFVAILGGAKISDKIGVIQNLLSKADFILIGGGMANTFLKAKGYQLADSLVEESALEMATDLMAQGHGKLVIPVDLVVANAFSAEAVHKVVAADKVDLGWRALDIGPQTIELFTDKIAAAATIVWNGPMGVFEMAPFAVGTIAVAHALANSHALTIIGGGDSVAAIEQAGLADKMTHISTGGGASLEFLEGLELPGIAALNDQ